MGHAKHEEFDKALRREDEVPAGHETQAWRVEVLVVMEGIVHEQACYLQPVMLTLQLTGH